MIYLIENADILKNVDPSKVLDAISTADLLEDVTKLKHEGKLESTDDVFVIVNSIIYDVLTTIGEYLQVKFRALPETILAFGSKNNVEEISRHQLDLLLLNLSSSAESSNQLKTQGEAKRESLLEEQREEVADRGKSFRRRQAVSRSETSSADEFEEEEDS